MFHHIRLLGEGFFADWTFVWFETGMQHLMFYHVGMLSKRLFAHWTLVRLQTSMK